jgi:hypothetical protein
MKLMNFEVEKQRHIYSGRSILIFQEKESLLEGRRESGRKEWFYTLREWLASKRTLVMNQDKSFSRLPRYDGEGTSFHVSPMCSFFSCFKAETEAMIRFFQILDLKQGNQCMMEKDVAQEKSLK